MGWRASDGVFRLILPSEGQVRGRAALAMRRNDLIAVYTALDGDSSSAERMNREELTNRIESALRSRGRILSY